jgi:hypothetical protein
MSSCEWGGGRKHLGSVGIESIQEASDEIAFLRKVRRSSGREFRQGPNAIVAPRIPVSPTKSRKRVVLSIV